MKIHVYRRNLKSGAISPHIVAAIEGFKRHGLNPVLKMPGAPEKCDLAVMWAFKKKAERDSGRRSLIIERGYVGDRFGMWTSCGFDGLNGRADFRNANSPKWRWDALCEIEGKHHLGGKLMQPWRTRGHEGDYVLIMGQVEGDASIANVRINDWYRTVALRLRHAGLRAAFRAHPLSSNIPVIPGLNAMSRDVKLDEAIRNAKWVVTYNSNSGVDAMLAGVPVVAVDEGSMVYGLAGKNPFIPPPMLDRTQWARDIAFAQWTLEEIRTGQMWDHLKAGMELSDAAATA